MLFKDDIQRIGDELGLSGKFLVDWGFDHIIKTCKQNNYFINQAIYQGVHWPFSRVVGGVTEVNEANKVNKVNKQQGNCYKVSVKPTHDNDNNAFNQNTVDIECVQRDIFVVTDTPEVIFKMFGKDNILKVELVGIGYFI